MIRIHKYVIIGAVIMLFIIIVYSFHYDHKEHISMSTHANSKEWLDSFRRAGIHEVIVEDITHDDDAWYFKGNALCVGYGDWSDRCRRHETYCGGGRVSGTMDEQVQAISEALKNGGSHPKCPLLYQGAN